MSELGPVLCKKQERWEILSKIPKPLHFYFKFDHESIKRFQFLLLTHTENDIRNFVSCLLCQMPGKRWNLKGCFDDYFVVSHDFDLSDIIKIEIICIIEFEQLQRHIVKSLIALFFFLFISTGNLILTYDTWNIAVNNGIRYIHDLICERPIFLLLLGA